MNSQSGFVARVFTFGAACLLGVAMVSLMSQVALAQTSASSSSTASSSSKVPSVDQALEMQAASGAELSPDGRWVVYEVSRTNWKANAFERDLWIADGGIADREGHGRLLTAQVKSSNGAQWSPDGRWIAFVSDRPGQVAETKADSRQILAFFSAFPPRIPVVIHTMHQFESGEQLRRRPCCSAALRRNPPSCIL